MVFPFILSINTSTLRPFGLSVPEQIEVAAKSGFAGIELWVEELKAYLDSGGELSAVRRLAQDAGIRIVNGIAFFKWTDADPTVRAAGMQQAEREIAMLAEIGCTAVAAPPTGEVADLDAATIGANYAELLELSRPYRVEPILEFWGRAPVLHSLNEATAILSACGDDDATMLLDLFHMYTGGSTVAEVRLLAGQDGGETCRAGLVHLNDYPADPPRDTIKDSDRVMPGDGVGPVSEFLRTLRDIEFVGPVSVELFMDDYGEPNAAGVARQAKEKTLRAWEAAE